MLPLEEHTTHMLAAGHLASAGLEGWMVDEGLSAVHLLRRVGMRWSTLARWGGEMGEPPWDLIDRRGGCQMMDASACARRAELRAAGQVAAALVSVGRDRMAWVTSSLPGWTPSETLVKALEWIPLGGGGGAGDEQNSGAHHAATAAHDIRNQLSLAMLRLEQLESTCEEELGGLRGALRSGRALCKSLLEGEESHADVSLRPLLEEEIRGALDAFPGCNVAVSLRCGARVFVHVSEAAVRRFVQNSLSNSLSASPEGSRILVEVTSAGRGQIELAVDDRGAGLSEEEVTRCFALGGSGRGSTGVGSESLIHTAGLLGSALLVTTAPGMGTRVSVQVLAARSERPVALLLDHDPSLCTQVRDRLEEAGWWVVCAGGVDDAVGGMDRWGAALAVTRRGACGGPTGELRAVASDLGVELLELRDGDCGQTLPPPSAS